MKNIAQISSQSVVVQGEARLVPPSWASSRSICSNHFFIRGSDELRKRGMICELSSDLRKKTVRISLARRLGVTNTFETSAEWLLRRRGEGGHSPSMGDNTYTP